MGKKKKKGLSNRLAKMSDEERARYLQHKAAIEEEARRRKEQLISTFMKNKTKREEAFARLNIAKINEYWHQILRKIAFKKMRTEIMNLSEWIKRVVELKNKIISQLMIEIDEAEEQYDHNFKFHTTFIDHFLDLHYHNQEHFRSDYEIKSSDSFLNAMKEIDAIKENSSQEFLYLRTIIFGMEDQHEKVMKTYKHHKEEILEDHYTSIRHEHEVMVNGYVATMDAIWQEIHATLSDYLSKTDVKRHHYIELKHLDERNRFEREDNERKIARYTETLNSLHARYASMVESDEARYKAMLDQQKKLNEEHTRLKRRLSQNLSRQGRKFTKMTIMSNDVVEQLKGVKNKGNSILQVVSCCRKLETEEERTQSWGKQRKNWYKLYDIVEKIAEEQVEEKGGLEVGKVEDSDVGEFLGRYRYLDDLKDLWWVHNRVELDVIDLKDEKKSLVEENRSFRKIIRGILEDAALEPARPKLPTVSKRQGVLSAPGSLSSSKFVPQVPNRVIIEF